jgi:tetratricopeptide (TPR) repeat protein
MGASLATFVFHLVHAALFVTLLWIALDPVFSLRRKNMLIPALPYLSALGIGYLAGYFLLVFKPLPDRMGRTTPVQILLDRVSRVAIILLFFLMPASLVFLNLPQIRITNGSAIRDYASALTENLPERGIILSDDARKLYLSEAALARAGKNQNYVFLDSQMLALPGYHAYQQKRHPDQWPSLPAAAVHKGEVPGGILQRLLFSLSQSNSITYLHPSFGYYFEIFDPRPRGLNLELKLYPTNSVFGPPLTAAELALNENFWNSQSNAMNRLLPFINPPAPTSNAPLKQVVLEKLEIPFRPNATALTLGRYYSQTLNFWGVQLQRAGKQSPAELSFQTAIDLFEDNLAAESNLAFTRELKAGVTPQLRPAQSVEAELGKYRNWQDALRDTGPFDDPTHCFGIGLMFAQGNLFREAAQQLERVHTFVPENPQVSFWLARLYIVNQQPDKARQLLADLRNRTEDLAAVGIRSLDLLQTDATSLFVSGKTDEANRLLEKALERNPTDHDVLAAVAQLSATFRSYTNAILAVDQMLKLKPDDVPALISKAVFNIQAGHFTNAIPTLDRVLTLQTNNYSAQLYRAVAFLSADKLDEAQKDYDSLQKIFPNSIEINSGFAEIAWRRKDTNTAVRYYELCLKNAPAGSEQEKFFSDRLNVLKQPAK